MIYIQLIADMELIIRNKSRTVETKSFYMMFKW